MIAHATAASHAELVALDGAARMRLLPRATRVSVAPIGRADRDLLRWLAAARCALTTQVHRRENPERSLTVTQRRLKRLADAGLIARFQMHRDDGGGLPLCCVVTARAIDLLGLDARTAPEPSRDSLDALRADVHVVGWLLAFERRAGDAAVEVLGPGRAAITPGVAEPAALDLGGELRARDFLVSRPGGSRTLVERFTAVRPSAAVDVRVAGAGEADRRDLLLVCGTRDPIRLLEDYDHLLSGWWRAVERYRRAGTPPIVVVMCTDRAQLGTTIDAADSTLTACLAEIGVAPSHWERPGRAGIHFVAEEDLHSGSLQAVRVPQLPPELRRSAHAEPLAGPFLQLPPRGDGDAAKPPWR